jgi:two-component system chemotaxis response regulator CheV
MAQVDTQGILTEAGTNELELLVFKIGSTPFGINVAKVREVIQQPETITIPHSPPAIKGSFKLRERVRTLIDLGKFFGMESEITRNGEGMSVVVEFNNICSGILIDKVERIYRLSWDRIQPPSQYLMDLNAPITGVVNIDDAVVLIIDFETIISEILGIKCITEGVTPIADTTCPDQPFSIKDSHILLADDSAVVRKSVKAILTKNGFSNLTIVTDGRYAWETIEATRGNADEQFDLILSDIEMPQMDGLHLTSKIKSDPEFQKIPVVLFSSLITKDNFRKGKSVGADAQVSKPDSDEMIKAIEDCIKKVRAKATA